MYNSEVAIILAAGRGSRMKGFTDDSPKCMLELHGKRLLEWQRSSLNHAEITEHIIVCGYLKELFIGEFTKIENPRWAETNMVSSLLCALNTLDNQTALISYSDIVYNSEHVIKLNKAKGDICITYDTKWESLWRLRNENPLDDAETFKEENGLLLEIGKKTKNIDDIQGQYMGLLKFTPHGQEKIKSYLSSLEPEQVDKLDMTSLLQALLVQGIEINTVAVEGAWCECDTQEDIYVYENELSKNPHWEHDWRDKK